MANITTCSKCNSLYEAGSEEQANEPDRLCFNCLAQEKNNNVRARTPQEKRMIIERLLAAWLCFPELRLGQLIQNAQESDDIFYVEDFKLITKIELYTNNVLTGGEFKNNR